jgi:hypothetical protein
VANIDRAARAAARAGKRALAEVERRAASLRELAAALGRELELRDLRSGQWMSKLAHAYLELHAEHRAARATPAAAAGGPEPQAHARTRPRAEQLVRRTAMASALGGAGAAGVTTGAIVATADSGGLAGLLTIPAAAAAIGGDMALRSLLHLRLTCELADLEGVALGPEDATEVLRLFAGWRPWAHRRLVSCWASGCLPRACCAMPCPSWRWWPRRR